MPTAAPRLALLAVGDLVAAPVRLALAVGLLGGALERGLAGRSAVAAVAVAGVLTAVLLVGRIARARSRLDAARPAPAGFLVESGWETGLRALWPSTVGLCLLGIVALALNAVLAAFIAGVLGVLAVLALAAALDVRAREQRRGLRLCLSRERRPRVYAAPREP